MRIIDCTFTNNFSTADSEGKAGVLGGTVSIYNKEEHLASNGNFLAMTGTTFIRKQHTNILGVLSVRGVGNADISTTHFINNDASVAIVRLNLKTSNKATFTDISFVYNSAAPIRRGNEVVVLENVTENGASFEASDL